MTNGLSLGAAGSLGWLDGLVRFAGDAGRQYRESHGLSAHRTVLASSGLRTSAPHVLQRAELTHRRLRSVRAGPALEPCAGAARPARRRLPVTLRVPAAASVRLDGTPRSGPSLPATCN
ncbi:OTU domain-containing protein OS=Streptomyces fumanus OX=67302 GN=GCM10018772_56770 PE=4 SV=1 [Streptomyces fumanus]